MITGDHLIAARITSRLLLRVADAPNPEEAYAAAHAAQSTMYSPFSSSRYVLSAHVVDPLESAKDGVRQVNYPGRGSIAVADAVAAAQQFARELSEDFLLDERLLAGS